MTYVILTLSISPLREGRIFCSELGFATFDNRVVEWKGSCSVSRFGRTWGRYLW